MPFNGIAVLLKRYKKKIFGSESWSCLLNTYTYEVKRRYKTCILILRDIKIFIMSIWRIKLIWARIMINNLISIQNWNFLSQKNTSFAVYQQPHTKCIPIAFNWLKHTFLTNFYDFHSQLNVCWQIFFFHSILRYSSLVIPTITYLFCMAYVLL